MNRLAFAALVASVLAAAVVIVATSSDLPVRVATHFGAGGAADGWMPRTAYTAVMLALVAGIPLIVLAKAVLLPPAPARRRWSFPHADYWLAPERRSATRVRLAGFAALIGTAVALFLAAIHLVVVDANHRVPPELPWPAFATALVVFLLAVFGVAGAMRVAFGQAPNG